MRAGFALALVTVALAGCGGGGSNGGGDNAGSSAALTYSGATSAAPLTGFNSSRLTSNIVGAGASAVIGGLAGVSATAQAGPPSSSGISAVARALDQGMRAARLSDKNQVSAPLAGVAVDTTKPCDSGSVHITGTVNSNGTGSITVSFSDCRTGNETLSGVGTAQVNAYDLATNMISDMTISFQLMSIRATGVSLDFSASMHLQIIVATNTETLTVGFVLRDNMTGNMTRGDNIVFVQVYDNVVSPSSFTQSVSGRIFDKTDGFVDVSTRVPFLFSPVNEPLPITGQMELKGAANSALRVTVIWSGLITIALDPDGDGIYDNTATLKWADLNGPVGADLSDNDGDGMHNSWETANHLDPNNAADANLDNDGDGFSNKTEYLAGTDPNDPASKPSPATLLVTLSADTSQVAVGSTVNYQIQVMNWSANPADNVVVTDTLPAELKFISVSGAASCFGTTFILCRVGTLRSLGSALILLAVSATSPGLVHNTAGATSSSYEVNVVDNIASTTTLVGQPTTGIQAMIDSAASGDTLTVLPGTYMGGLDFHGKNITLQSRDGPASTILSGGGPAARFCCSAPSVVAMGPGGTLKGFTIAGGTAQIGAGVRVINSGSLITGNIFDGNSQGGGGSGAAIGGYNGASPTIQRNIFRNNSCDLQSLSGVVAFFNSSFPVIVNNIFERNPCRAVNLGAQPEGTFQIVNNTFVGNWTGIRLAGGMALATQVYRNNILVGNGSGLEMEFGDIFNTSVWANNLVFGNAIDYNGPANLTGTNGNISANPLFVDQDNGNYHLRGGSPAIGAGSPLNAPAIDFDGVPRPGSAIDIGAFQVQH